MGFFQQFHGSFVAASSLPCAGVFTVKSARSSAAVHGSRFTWVAGDEADESVAVDGCERGTKKVVASAAWGK